MCISISTSHANTAVAAWLTPASLAILPAASTVGDDPGGPSFPGRRDSQFFLGCAEPVWKSAAVTEHVRRPAPGRHADGHGVGAKQTTVGSAAAAGSASPMPPLCALEAEHGPEGHQVRSNTGDSLLAGAQS